ncbi:MAG: glycosyltransferase family 4 protein [Bernardetiaceae bacterium]|nr:glycosyltransferase family 4 protein [Bernardetiaceae bacterium]
MKIGIVVNSAWNIYNFRKGLIASFINKNYEVVAIAADDGYAEQIEAMGCSFEPLAIEAKGTNPFQDVRLFSQLYKIYKKHGFDVILHYTIKPNIYGTLAAKALSIPVINNVTGLGTVFIHRGISSRVARLLYKISFRFPALVFFQNGDDLNLFLQKGLIKKHIADTLPGSGVDIDHFQPQLLQAHASKPKTFTFLLIARLLYDKGILEYIEAIRLLQAKGVQAKFQILGKLDEGKKLGIPECDIQKWVDEGLIEYLGTVSDVRPAIINADCVVLPSYREGTPRTLLEAASLGKPLIATDVPGCRETVIHNYNGYLCKVKDPYDLADKMQRLMQMDNSYLAELGRNSRHVAETKFDQRIVIRKYEKAINRLPLQKQTIVADAEVETVANFQYYQTAKK